jgi:hypothetical protein
MAVLIDSVFQNGNAVLLTVLAREGFSLDLLLS